MPRMELSESVLDDKVLTNHNMALLSLQAAKAYQAWALPNFLGA